ncbi:MAG TPA: DUF1186 domain-containing protein [Xanthobacteraceae bacterium]
MDATQILHELASADGMPVEAIRAASANRAAVAPAFVQVIERFVAGEYADADADALFLVFHLLGEWREKSAYRPLAALLRLPRDDIGEVLGDAIPETSHRVMAAVFDGDPGPLYEIIREPDADETIRSRMCETLAMLTLRGELPREQAAVFLRACFRELAPQDTCFVWDGWQHAIAMLGLADLVPLVHEAFERELIHPGWLDFKDFEEDLANALAGKPAGQIEHEFELFGDTIEELSTWGAQGEDEDAGDGGERVLWSAGDGPAVNPYRDVGRNDPCPCGSGKKFKKCCLDKIEAQQLERATAARFRPGADVGDAFVDDPPLTAYDPLIEPDSGQWTALDEDERLRLVKDYHRRAGIDLPQEDLHASIHAAVENQIAELDERTYRKLDALIAEGLDRHEAIHAIGSVLAIHLHDIMREAPVDGVAFETYHAELAKLTAASWRRAFS